METSSWSLRIALLLIGLGMLGGIWLWAQLRRRRDLNHGYTRKIRSLRTPPIPRAREDSPLEDDGGGVLPEDDYEIIVKPREQRVDDLPKIIRNPDVPIDPARQESPHIAPDEPIGGRASRRRRSDQLSLGFEDESAVAPSSMRPRTPGEERRVAPTARAAAAEPEMLALYLLPLRSPAFLGPALQRAFTAVGLRFGNMNIYHHYGAGDLRAERPLFSVVNMYEPGYFDPAAMDEFETAGLAMFIQFPAPLDGPVAFELFLNTAQRLAEALHADLRSDPNHALDGAAIESMRLIAARHSEYGR